MNMRPVLLVLLLAAAWWACAGSLTAAESHLNSRAERELQRLGASLAEADEALAEAEEAYLTAVAEAQQRAVEALKRCITSRSPVLEQAAVFKEVLKLDASDAEARGFFDAIGSLDEVLADLAEGDDFLAPAEQPAGGRIRAGSTAARASQMAAAFTQVQWTVTEYRGEKRIAGSRAAALVFAEDGTWDLPRPWTGGQGDGEWRLTNSHLIMTYRKGQGVTEIPLADVRAGRFEEPRGNTIRVWEVVQPEAER